MEHNEINIVHVVLEVETFLVTIVPGSVGQPDCGLRGCEPELVLESAVGGASKEQ